MPPAPLALAPQQPQRSLYDKLGETWPAKLGKSIFGALAPTKEQQVADPMFGYKIRGSLHPGENDYFKSNPHVTGMAAETGDVILNPYSSNDINKNAVARNEALRLWMRDNSVTPDFQVTPQQRNNFVGTSYENDDPALRQTIAARIYSGDPSAAATDEQRAYVDQMVQAASLKANGAGEYAGGGVITEDAITADMARRIAAMRIRATTGR